jgi:hypothetical protein
MSVRKREKLFLGTLEEFRFDFGGADGSDPAVLPATGAVAGDEDSDARALAPLPSVLTPLTLKEVDALRQLGASAGSQFFALPSSAATMDEALQQFRRQMAQMTQREVLEMKEVQRAKAQAQRAAARQRHDD